MSGGLFSDKVTEQHVDRLDLPTHCPFLYFQENMLGSVHMYAILIFSKLNVF